MKSLTTLTLLAGVLVSLATITLSTPAQAYPHNWVREQRRIQRVEARQARQMYYASAANPYYNPYYAAPVNLSVWQRMRMGLPL